MSPSTLENNRCATSAFGLLDAEWVRIRDCETIITEKAEGESWVALEIGAENEDVSWEEVENMEPTGDELDRLVDLHPAPREWYEEWLN